MAKTNSRAKDYRVDTDDSHRLAGGAGKRSAVQNDEGLLRRAVMACLLWEDLYYTSGKDAASNIANLVWRVDPQKVAEIAIEARNVQMLRHVPLYIAVQMAKYPEHRKYIRNMLPQILKRADEPAELLSLYWKDNGKEKPIPASFKRGIAAALLNFDEYQLAKYRGESNEVKLRDVIRIVHPTPASQDQSKWFEGIVKGTMKQFDTWENELSAGKDKKATWTHLIEDHKLGGLAFLRNLRNMEEAGVSRDVITKGFETVNTKWLLPLNYIGAAEAAPRWEREIESLMLKSLGNHEKLPGYTVVILDASGSMGAAISGKSKRSRWEIAAAMAMLLSETCEHIAFYANAGRDPQWDYRTNKRSGEVSVTELMKPRRGFAMKDDYESAMKKLGGGGIFTRQAIEYVKGHENGKIDRIIVISDSADMSTDNAVPAPNGDHNYIIDVSAEARGVKYDGVWDAEVSGWSEHFVDYIRAYEGLETISNDQQSEN